MAWQPPGQPAPELLLTVLSHPGVVALWPLSLPHRAPPHLSRNLQQTAPTRPQQQPNIYPPHFPTWHCPAPPPPTHCTYRLDLLSQTLTWRHLAPTAPDTLTCYPFADDDPFVLQQCPHVLFAGNQPAFETRLQEGECVSARGCSCVGGGCVCVCVFVGQGEGGYG